VFARLSVEENLRIAVRKGAEWQLDTVYEHFPALADRRRSMGDQLSGGEQQMLVVARALVNAPSLILLDEPSEGLAPVIVDRLRQIVHMVRDLGISILLVEQNINFCLQVADRVYVLDNGRIVFEGGRNEFEGDDTVRDTYLSLRSVPG
jgi:branched-chain amino acid transport system ATP-binding protein